MSISDIQERMAALKAKHDTNTRSELHAQPTHLWTIVDIYNKSSHDCYIDYMEGFKLLLDWLCPTANQLVLPASDYIPNLPRLLGGYELQEVSAIVATKVTAKINANTLPLRNSISRAIAYHSAKAYAPLYL